MDTEDKLSLPTLNDHDSQLCFEGTSDPFVGVPTKVRNFTKSSFGTKLSTSCMISGFIREVAENRALLGCHAASSGDFLATFRDSLPVPSSGGLYYHYSLRNTPIKAQFSTPTPAVTIVKLTDIFILCVLSYDNGRRTSDRQEQLCPTKQ